jgi:hypothetical protein
MTRYFDLMDDVTIPGRWHLGDVLAEDGSEPRLRAGIPFGGGRLVVPVHHPGIVLDFCLTSFAVPIASAALARAVAAVAGDDVECLPVEIAGQHEMMVLNATRLVRCLDESRCEFIKWTKEDHRADLAGQYRQVSKLMLDPLSIPADVHFFRVEGWRVALIVSEAVKVAMERAGCQGAQFEQVSPTR